MIHTAKFYIRLKDTEVKKVCINFKDKITLVSKEIDIHFRGITSTFTKRFNQWWLFLNIDFIKMLGKSNIREVDLKQFQSKIKEYLYFVFGENDKELTLVRLDFRLDAVVSNERHRELLLKIYKKTFDHYGYKRKNDNYKTTVYFNSKSVKVMVYDKEVERSSKNSEVEPHEKDILRYEVCLQNRHLNYMKKAYGFDKKLETYLSTEFWEKYMDRNVCPVFFSGDFYRIGTATTIIRESCLSARVKENLRRFLCDVSKYGLDGIGNLERVTIKNGTIKQKYTKFLVKKYIKLLEELRINPLLIPKNYSLKLGTDKCIRNPLQIVPLVR